MGTQETAVWPQGYRSGMTMHELRFDLAATSPAALTMQRDAALVAARDAVGRL